MNGAQEPATNFSGLANAGQSADVYAGITEVQDATKKGEYEKNTNGLKKPWTLPIYRPPAVKPVF